MSETFEDKLVRENLAWLDKVAAEKGADVAIGIAKSNGADVAGAWGTVWLETRGYSDVPIQKRADALVEYAKAAAAHTGPKPFCPSRSAGEIR